MTKEEANKLKEDIKNIRDNPIFMTLDECIKYAEYQSEWMSKYAMYDIYKNKSEYYRQLAEWLKELKALNENDDVKDVFKDCDTCKYQSLEPDDFPCDRCCHRYINQYVYDNKREVNADV